MCIYPFTSILRYTLLGTSPYPFPKHFWVDGLPAFPFGGICDRSQEGISFIFYHDVCKFTHTHIHTHNAYTSMSFSGRFWWQVAPELVENGCKQVMKTLAINSDVIHMVSRLFHIMVPSFVVAYRCFFFVCVFVVLLLFFELELYNYNEYTYVFKWYTCVSCIEKIIYYTRLSPSGKCMTTFHGLSIWEKQAGCTNRKCE